MPAHPLRKDPKWRFQQPTVTVKSSFVAIGPGMPKGRAYAVSGSSMCREGTIHALRRGILRLVARQEVDPESSWKKQQWRLLYKVDLEDPRNKRPSRTTISISRSERLVGRGDRKFLHVADAIMGPIGVLINPDRPKGCCRASTVRNVGNRGLAWHGVDNTILYTPALVAMFAGLYRQCALLCKIGYADEILGLVDRTWIRDTINNSDAESAREIIKVMRPWIEVPVPRMGHRTNMVFPSGYFSRLEQMSQAVDKHGPHTVFSGAFSKSWGLIPSKINTYHGIRGLWTAWGSAKRGNAEYRIIAELSRSPERSRPAIRG